MLEIPFHKNRGYNCAEYNLKSILEYYFPKKRFKIKDIGKLLKRETGKNPYMFQLVDALFEFGLEVDYFSGYGLDRLLNLSRCEKIEEFKRHFGNSAREIIDKTDFDSFEYVLERVVRLDRWKKLYLEFSDVETAFSEGKVVVCLLNYDVFYGRENNFKGHYVVTTDIGDDFVTYHSVGPSNAEPNKRVPKESFINCWNKTCFFDENTIFIKGR